MKHMDARLQFLGGFACAALAFGCAGGRVANAPPDPGRGIASVPPAPLKFELPSAEDARGFSRHKQAALIEALRAAAIDGQAGAARLGVKYSDLPSAPALANPLSACARAGWTLPIAADGSCPAPPKNPSGACSAKQDWCKPVMFGPDVCAPAGSGSAAACAASSGAATRAATNALRGEEWSKLRDETAVACPRAPFSLSCMALLNRLLQARDAAGVPIGGLARAEFASQSPTEIAEARVVREPIARGPASDPPADAAARPGTNRARHRRRAREKGAAREGAPQSPSTEPGRTSRPPATPDIGLVGLGAHGACDSRELLADTTLPGEAQSPNNLLLSARWAYGLMCQLNLPMREDWITERHRWLASRRAAAARMPPGFRGGVVEWYDRVLSNYDNCVAEARKRRVTGQLPPRPQVSLSGAACRPDGICEVLTPEGARVVMHVGDLNAGFSLTGQSDICNVDWNWNPYADNNGTSTVRLPIAQERLAAPGTAPWVNGNGFNGAYGTMNPQGTMAYPTQPGGWIACDDYYRGRPINLYEVAGLVGPPMCGPGSSLQSASAPGTGGGVAPSGTAR